MKLGKMSAQNFMSITNTEFDFSNRGLLLIQGDNEDSDAFESNGSGKSTVFSETVVWALFGETIRGHKADKVINRKVGKNTMVSLDIEDDNGDLYTIQRYRKHKEHKDHVLLFRNGNNITGKSDKDTNQLIIDLIQMDFKTFTNSVMFGQGLTKMFSVSTDAEQKRILESMLQIDIYKACMELAKKQLAEKESSMQKLESDIMYDRNTIKTTEESIHSMQDKEAKLEQQVKERVQELNDERNGYEEELGSLPDGTSLQEEINSLKSLVDGLDTKLDGFKKYEDSLSDLVSDKKALTRELSTINQKRGSKREELADIQDGKNIPKTCETCGQDLPLEDTSHIENHLKETIKNLGMEWQEKKEEIEETDSLIEKVETVLKGKVPLEEQRSELLSAISDAETELALSVSRRDQIKSTLRRIDKQIKEQEELLGTTYSELIEEAINNLEDIKERLKVHSKELDALQVEIEQYKFWVSAYGNSGIKSVMLDSVVPFLNTRANYYLQKLADSSIEVKFNTQTTLASGEVRDKFKVDVTNENGDDEYKGNSNGEKRRIDVAINMSLQDLVLSRSNKRLDCIVFDEVFEGLDAIGSEKVISLLKEKAEEVGTILVITHNESLKQLFNDSVTVRKVLGKTEVIG